MRRTNLLILPLLALAALSACGGGEGGGGGGGNGLEIGMWTPSGNNQSDTVGQTLPKVIRVRVYMDSVPAAGHMVHFSGISGDLGTDSVLSDEFGVATSTWTLGPLAGSQFVSASLSGAFGSPVIFHATGLVGTPFGLQMVSGDSGISAPGLLTSSSKQPTVRAVDANGNPTPGVWIHYSVTGPAVLGADSIITNNLGLAVLNVFGGLDTGVSVISAAATGLANSPIEFQVRTVTTIREFGLGGTAYSPTSVIMKAGSAVRWTWNNGTHSVTSTGSPSFPSANTTSAPAVYGPIYFPDPGVYEFFCQVHAGMTGTITVNP